MLPRANRDDLRITVSAETPRARGSEPSRPEHSTPQIPPENSSRFRLCYSNPLAMSRQDIIDTTEEGSVERQLFDRIDLSKLPAHIAVIMDGNGRWAKVVKLGYTGGDRFQLKGQVDLPVSQISEVWNKGLEAASG